jgi:putative phage-type endonuclease
MTNQYHDSEGKFTSREGQLGNIQRAMSSNNFSLYMAEVEALKEADTANQYVASSLKSIFHPALANAEAEKLAVAKLVKKGDKNAIKEYMDERTERPEFVDLLTERDTIREKAKNLKDEYTFLKEMAKDPNFDYELVRDKGFELLDAYEELQVYKKQANDYKDITAPLAAKLSEIVDNEARANGTFNEYTDSQLNDLVETGEFPSGSREWLEQRQKGIGGSDVGKITGVYKSGPTARQEIIDAKIAPITDEEVAAQATGHTEFTGATGRGNAWEQLIAQKYAENHPEQNVTFCKTSWANSKVPYQFANFDGLLVDENGKPNGILEIKTASDASKWGDPKDGLDAVPPGYRAQVLWYAQAANLDHGAVAVMIDDREYREYNFKMTPKLRAEAAANLAKVDDFVKEVDAQKSGETLPRTTPRRTGFGKTLINDTRLGKTDRAFVEASAWREESIAATKKRYEKLVGENKNDPAAVEAALTKLYTEKNPATRKRPFINIDLETSNTSSTNGRIIELGISKRDPNTGEELENYSQLFGLPRRVLDAQGTGAVHVHHITEGKIAKKRSFSHPTVQKEALRQLKSGILVAHNAPFEISWLSQHLNGFAKALRKGDIKVVDTMYLTQRFVPESKDNKLSGMSEVFDVPYVNAHRAYIDASIMGVSLHKFTRYLFAKNK